MALTTDILATYRNPSKVFRRLMDDNPREDRALLFALIGCGLAFIAQAPYQSRLAFLDPSVPIEARLYWSGFFLIFILPLLLYVLAAVSHIIALPMKGEGKWLDARLALFWSVLASAPILLLLGLVAGMIGGGAGLNAVAICWLVAFGTFWITGLWHAEWRPRKQGE